jgi:hypothetical protein
VIVDVSNFYHICSVYWPFFFGKRQDIILASNEDLHSSPGNNDRMTQMWSIDHMQYIFLTDFLSILCVVIFNTSSAEKRGSQKKI